MKKNVVGQISEVTGDTVTERISSKQNDTVVMPAIRPSGSVSKTDDQKRADREYKELVEFYSSSEFVRLKDGSWVRKKWLAPTPFEHRWRERHTGTNSNNCILLSAVCSLTSGMISFGVLVMSGSLVAALVTNFCLYLGCCLSSLSMMEFFDKKALKHLHKYVETKKIPNHLRSTMMESFFCYGTLFLVATSLGLLFFTMHSIAS